MNQMNIADVDLNLLKVFEALHDETSASRAALRLGVTQSAVSAALRRLRDVYDDQLFIRTGRGLAPTLRANQLKPVVTDALNKCRQSLAMVDPFLRPRDAIDRLRRAGISGVANFPTMQIVDGETARAFEGADARTTREVQVLEAFLAEGFRTIAFACGPDAARLIAQTCPTMMVLHPGVALSDWRQRAASALAVQRMIEHCRLEAGCPVLVYRPAGFGSELDQAVAAADGEVKIET